MFIAIVSKCLEIRQPLGCFIDGAKDEVIKAAFRYVKKCEASGHDPLRIFVGELSTEIVTPSVYREVPIVRGA